MAAPPGGWQISLLDCPSLSRCCYTHLLFPFAAGQIAQRTHGSYILDCLGGGVVGCFFCLYCVPWGLTRSRLRGMHGIEGSLVDDFLVTLCCPPCYLAQALAQLDAVDAADRARAATSPQMVMR